MVSSIVTKGQKAIDAPKGRRKADKSLEEAPPNGTPPPQPIPDLEVPQAATATKLSSEALT